MSEIPPLGRTAQCLAALVLLGEVFLAARRGRMRPSGGIGTVEDAPVFHGYRGIRAILKIMIERREPCRNAYTLGDGTPVDIIWGAVTDVERHKGYGVAHILDKHGWEFRTRPEMAAMIDRTIRTGIPNLEKSYNNCLVLDAGNERVVLARFHGRRRRFVITAFKKIKEDG